ncbi:MAG: hypothetical protein J7L88_06545 [Thermoplasmata archaeon]|nr:hypothetical protein [Thermoplasmata archaeon]
MRGETVFYLCVLSASLFLLPASRELLGLTFAAASVLLIFLGYLTALFIDDKTYMKIHGRKELLFFLTSIVLLVTLLIILLFNFQRSPGSVLNIVMGGVGIRPFSISLLVILSLIIGASAGVSDREGRREALSRSLFAFLPIIVISHLATEASVSHNGVILEGALGVILLLSFEMAWRGEGGRAETLYTLENGLLALLTLGISYILWLWVIDGFYTSRGFPGLFISAAISTIAVGAFLYIFWKVLKKV